MSLDYLPGVQVFTVDGGIVARRTPRTKSVLVIGTAGQGPSDTAYQVVDRADAAQIFGFNGTLVRGMEEVASYSDNIYLFRMGTKAGKVTGVGKDTGTGVVNAGFDIEIGERTEDAGSRYKVWYAAGILYVFKDDVLVWANDSSAGKVLDAGDVIVTGLGVAGGLEIGDDDTLAKTPAGAIALDDLDTLTGSTDHPLPAFTAPVTGLGLSGRQTYVALAKAFELLQIFQVQIVYCPNAVADQPNVAFYAPVNAGSPTADEAKHDPTKSTDALGWLKTTIDSFNNKTFHWANETKDSEGATKTAVTFTDAADRIAKSYHEVSFAYLIAAYCAKQSQVTGGCLGFVGTSGPKNYRLPGIREWIGFLPTYDPITGFATVSGKGQLGVPYLVGCALASLNSLTSEHANGETSRHPGLFQNAAWEYDGGADLDRNQNKIDIGAYLHTVGGWAGLNNGWGSYVGNCAGIVAGWHSAADEKEACTNKPLPAVTGLYRLTWAQLNALTEAKVNDLVFKNFGKPYYLLHDMTSAAGGDYIYLLRQRIKFLVVQAVQEEGDKFVGQSTTDGLQLQALKTALDSRANALKKGKYIGMATFAINATEAERRIGHANIDVAFTPADELIQLKATVGIHP